MMRLLGVREAINGLALLTQSNKSLWVKARIAGDVMDLALLAAAFRSPKHTRKSSILATTGTVAGITALDLLCERKLRTANGRSTESRAKGGPVRVARSITIDRPAQELYQKWRNLADLPKLMSHLESVTVLDEKRSHWVAKAPAGATVKWDAEITEDTPGHRIAWRSLEGARVPNEGSVEFRPSTGNRGTVITVRLQYAPPGGVLGAKMAKLFGEEPQKQIAVDLLRFKQFIETGEIATTQGQPAGRTKSTSRVYDDFVRA
jgi:uncharacterized membrane protein